MLATLEGRRAAAREIVEDAMRGDDGDPFGALNALDAKFFRSARVNVQIPILDPAQTRRALVFLIEELPALIAEMDRTAKPRSKSLLAEQTLRRWSHAFSRWGKKG
jgi:hypothetical protein